MNSLITSAYLVSGMPHVLLAPEKNKGWQSLSNSYAEIRKEIAESDADMILYFSTQWLSVLGYMFQGDPEPKWTHVDPNWYEYGDMDYQFKVDTDFAEVYADEAKQLGHNTRIVNYYGFPIDTGTIVAQKLINPDNKIPAAMVSCNMYAEKEETSRMGQAAGRALERSGKKAIAVLVSNLSNRFEIKDIDPSEDKISSLKDDEWNQKILELLGEGRIEDVSQCAREFGRQANGDLGFKGIWWLNALCGKSNHFTGKVFDYQPVYGAGAGLVGLYPTEPVGAVSLQESFESEEGSQAQIAEELAERTHGTPVFEGAAASSQTEEMSKSLSQFSTSASGDRPIIDRAIESQTAPEPVGPYPHARKHGNLLFLSGVGPRKKGTKDIPGVSVDAEGNVIGHNIEKQTRSVIENVKTILEEAGSSLEKVLDVQVFLTDMKGDFKTFNKIYGEYFSKIGPTRTTVEITSLPTPIAIEFKVIARP